MSIGNSLDCHKRIYWFSISKWTCQLHNTTAACPYIETNFMKQNDNIRSTSQNLSSREQNTAQGHHLHIFSHFCTAEKVPMKPFIRVNAVKLTVWNYLYHKITKKYLHHNQQSYGSLSLKLRSPIFFKVRSLNTQIFPLSVEMFLHDLRTCLLT